MAKKEAVPKKAAGKRKAGRLPFCKKIRQFDAFSVSQNLTQAAVSENHNDTNLVTVYE